MYKRIIIIFYFVLFIILWNCAPHTGYKLKTFLFDGVPNPFEVVTKDTITVSEVNLDTTVVAVNNKIREIKGSIHKPYADKECQKCHNRAVGNTSKTSENTKYNLCFDCHDNINNKFEFNHAPVISGACNTCHNPHKSEYKKLVITEGQALCLSCHQQNDVMANKFHQTIADKSCTLCHNPHGGNNFTMINKNGCVQCHEQVVSYPVLHGPVAGGDCSMCHTTHGSKTKNLLVRSGNNLCTHCHDPKETALASYHKNTKVKDCAGCHNPHGSSNKYLLNTPN